MLSQIARSLLSVPCIFLLLSTVGFCSIIILQRREEVGLVVSQARLVWWCPRQDWSGVRQADQHRKVWLGFKTVWRGSGKSGEGLGKFGGTYKSGGVSSKFGEKEGKSGEAIPGDPV